MLSCVQHRGEFLSSAKVLEPSIMSFDQEFSRSMDILIYPYQSNISDDHFDRSTVNAPFFHVMPNQTRLV